MSALYAMFDDGPAAQRAVDGLRKSGLHDSQITVITALPFEDQEFGETDKATWMWYLASLGGFVGLGLSTWLIVFTETTWPINVGNMPIVAWWPNLVIIFEMTMLGAIVTNVISLLVTAKLPKFRRALYDPAVSDGKILVGAPAATANEAAIRDALGHSGASSVKTVEL